MKMRCLSAGLGVALLMTVSVESASRAAAIAADTDLLPRTPVSKPDTIAQPEYDHRLIVKFHDRLLARTTAEGAIVTIADALAQRDLAGLDDLVRRHDLSFTQLIQLPQERLDFLEERAARASGIAQPDLAGMMIVHAPHEELQEIADALLASDLTEFVYFQELTPPPPGFIMSAAGADGTPCVDIPPATPQYFPLQTYHGPNPGMNMSAAWQMGPTRGAGIRVADCEYWYNGNHEDLCDIIAEPGQTPHPNVIQFGWDEHGTAVLGQLVSADNEYGCTGLVPEAQAYFFPEWTEEEGGRRVTAITNAIATMGPGDVVLLEMQTVGAGGGYGPAELDPAVWTVTKNGTDAGVIVVAAAGNGNQNLDSAPYQNYMSWGDSGAIIVGAGSSNTGHHKLSFSTYGSRVNVQGWGQNVFTLGYGSYAEHGGDKNQRYTHQFSGTSSASPFITAAAVALQGVAEEYLCRRLKPLEIREILIDTGIPQGSGGHIGPFPDMVAAVEAVKDMFTADLTGDGKVDGADLGVLLANWGQCADCDDCPADLNCDCIVDGTDLGILLSNWG